MMKTLVHLPWWQLVLLAAVALFLGAALVSFILAALRELGAQLVIFMGWLRIALADAGRAATQGFIAAARVALQIFATGFLWVASPLWRKFQAHLGKTLALLQQAHHYAKAGHREFASFSAYRAGLKEDEELNAFRDGANGPNAENLSAYERALAVMGLTADEASSMPQVKQRYRQLMAICHPDRGFPNTLFAQQLNEAMDVLKREHGYAS